MYKKGSITVYLSLMLMILLSLLMMTLHLGQTAGGKMYAAHAADQGIYSLFARYDIPMLERYHLFFLDGSFGGETLRIGSVYSLLERDISLVLQNVNGGPNENRLIDGLKLENGSVDGYTLATDCGGNAVKSQAIAYMEAILGVQSVRSLVERVKKQEDVVEELEQKELNEKTYWEIYDSVAGEQSLELVEEVRTERGKGILNLVLPGSEISTSYVPRSQMVSGRERQQGLGVPVYDRECDSWQSELLFGEYLLRHFGCYTTKVETEGLQYQLEYMIQGASSDMENLKGVASKILAIREVINLQKIYLDAEKRAQAKRTALAFATVCLHPEAAPALEHVLLFCWAFQDSVEDVRTLLEGGSVLLGNYEMSYEDYLRVLLLTKNQDEKLMRCMDMMEDGLQVSSGNQAYRLDHCIYHLNVTLQFQMKHGGVHEVTESMGYQS